MTDAVVVVSYASSALLTASLGPLTDAGFLGIVVDNYSSVAEQDRVGDLAVEHGWAALWQDNTGFGEAVNSGVALARELGCDRFVVLNPDAELDPDSARLLLATADTAGTLAAPRIERPDGSVWFAGALLDLRDGRTRSRSRSPQDEVPWLTGACLAFTQATWQQVGGFADDYFLYWEDVDLSYRLSQAGGKLVVVAEAHCVHAEGGTQTQGGAQRRGQAKSPLYYRYNIANRLVFCARNLDTAAWRRWIMATPQVSWEILLQGGRRQLLASPKPLWAAAVGMATGLVKGWRIRRRAKRSS